jgi:hypothetical protein
MPVVTKGKRAEERERLRVEVDLSSINPRLPAHFGVTDNVSRHGARILTSRPWQPDDRLNLRSLKGSLRSRGRVVYCRPQGEVYAVGLHLYAIVGDWLSPA